ncbi:hypothetical protein XENOCAPTIV_010282 [Xenoophorus captivus]|uniref:MHC class I antigen n=1 Tax=Xenoophorus captivus TaxID=1517983 RepID=A0ABV0RYP4_9TELE
MAFYDTETDLVTCAVDGVLYRHISSWEAGCVQGVFFTSQKNILVGKELGLNLPRDHGGTDHGLSRQVEEFDETEGERRQGSPRSQAKDPRRQMPRTSNTWT